MRKLRVSLSDEQYAGLQGSTDSEHLFAVLIDEYERQADDDGAERLVQAVRAALRRVEILAVDASTAALLTIIVSDGQSLVAARAATGADPPSLHVLPGPSELAPGTVVASEPLNDDEAWFSLTPGRVIGVSSGRAPREVTLR